MAHSDVVKAQLQMVTQKQALEDARLAVENARLDLAVLLSKDFDENFSVVDDLDVAPALPTLDDVNTMVKRENPAMGAAIEAMRAASLDVKLARQAYLPTLTVDAVYGIEANAFALHSTVAANKDVGPLPNLGYFVTASLNIPVWDWGIRRSTLNQAELKKAEAEVDLNAAQRTLMRNLRGYYDEARVSRQQVDLLRSAVDLSSENLRLNTLRYQSGDATILELEDAQTAIIKSRNANDDAIVLYRFAICTLQTLTGTF